MASSIKQEQYPKYLIDESSELSSTVVDAVVNEIKQNKNGGQINGECTK